MLRKYNVLVQYAAWVAVCTLGTVVLLSSLHLRQHSRSATQAARARARLTALAISRAVTPALGTNDINSIAGLVSRAMIDEEIYHIRILDREGRVVYRSVADRTLSDLVFVTEPVQDGDQPLGSVEVGISQAEALGNLLRLVYTELATGLLLVAVAVAASWWAARPVRDSLRQLLAYVEEVAEGRPPRERLDSALMEVDRIGAVLNTLMHRVSDAQRKMAKAQTALQAAQKEMDEYTYVISHDLKEPLRGIEAFSRFLVDDYRDRLDEEGRHHVDVIRSSALRMQRLINDLLKFSRLSQQKQPMAPVGLNAMLMHVRVNLQYALDAKKVDLRVDKLPTVECDATAMTEVFHNLISNAVKYNDKPHPVIEVGCTDATHPETGRSEYQFAVRDNGMGIKAEYFEKIFHLFQRLQRDDEGTGIGLTIVKRVLEWHGGRLWVESAPGQGTTFYFTLPKDRRDLTATHVELAPVEAQEGDHAIAQAI
ncbi:hypothetical protein HQ590_07400 [bacterium]|nr:hypothetical protein [bacterium]